jgi:elongation factor 1-beta
VDLVAQIKMANVIITLKIMPSGPDASLEKIQEEANNLIKEFAGDIGKVEHEPVAFGLKAVKIMFVMDESKGDTEELEKKIGVIDGVNSVEVTDVRRAVG